MDGSQAGTEEVRRPRKATMSKVQASISNRKSSSPAAALVMTKSSLTFQLHPKQLVAFRSKATEILYRGAAGGGKPHLMRSGCSVIAGLQVRAASSHRLLCINVARHVAILV
jgi:hypothetical protein